MATNVNALLQIRALATVTATSPASGDVVLECVNAPGGTRWTNGTGSGNVDRVLFRSETMASGETDSYNLLAAGGLTDIYGQAIDADELKGIIIKCLTGSISFKAPASNFLTCFGAAGDKIKLAATHCQAIDFGAAGLTLSTSASFDIAEEGSAAATYELWFDVAQ